MRNRHGALMVDRARYHQPLSLSPSPTSTGEVGGESERGGEISGKSKSSTPPLHPPCVRVGSTETPATGSHWRVQMGTWGEGDQSQSQTCRQQQEEERRGGSEQTVLPSGESGGKGEPPASPGGQRLTSPSRTGQTGSSHAASSCDLTPHLSFLPKALGWGLESSSGRRARKPLNLDLNWVPTAVWGPPRLNQPLSFPRL